MKRLLIIIGCAALLALACIQLYSRFIDRDMQFFLKVAEASDGWAEQLHATERPVYVLAGGSEARSGVDPQIMLDEFGIPLINAAEGAGHGLQANANVAFKYLKPGDTLILSILSTDDVNVPPSASGMKLNVYRMGARLFDSGLIEPSMRNAGNFLSSDMRSLFTLLTRYFGKAGRLYKYDEQTIVHPSGWMSVEYREMDNCIPGALPASAELPVLDESSLFIETLRKLQAHCREKNISLIISIPVGCNDTSMKPQYAMKALSITRHGIPVLKDERLGCLPVPTDFADTSAHLNAKAAAENSRVLGRLIKEKQYWTEQELLDTLQGMGYQADGTPQQ